MNHVAPAAGLAHETPPNLPNAYDILCAVARELDAVAAERRTRSFAERDARKGVSLFGESEGLIAAAAIVRQHSWAVSKAMNEALRQRAEEVLAEDGRLSPGELPLIADVDCPF